MVMMLLAAMRVTSALKLPDWGRPVAEREFVGASVVAEGMAASTTAAPTYASHVGGLLLQTRVAAVNEILTRASARESEQLLLRQQLDSPARQSMITEAAERSGRARPRPVLGLGSRRNAARRTRSAAGRDQRR
jgi:hypothetical protein